MLKYCEYFLPPSLYPAKYQHCRGATQKCNDPARGGFKLWNLLERFGKREIRVSTVVALVNTRAALRLIRGRVCHRWRIGGRTGFDLGRVPRVKTRWALWQSYCFVVASIAPAVIEFNVQLSGGYFSVSLSKSELRLHLTSVTMKLKMKKQFLHLISFSSQY